MSMGDVASTSGSSNNFTRRAPVVVPAASAFFTPTVPGLPSGQAVSLASGYLPARPPKAGSTEPQDDAHLYFVLERARHLASKKRLIIWFNGGPGCSSFDGLMMEIGAFRTNMNADIEWTTPGGAWNEYADVLYLDQPVGTGFSYASTSGYAHTLDQAAHEVVYFLQRFVEVYPEYKSGNGVDLYLAGESFAGQYIPYTASALLKAGKDNPVDLKGIAIGNGYIDPWAQSGTELEMMVSANIWKETSNEYVEAEKFVKRCREAVDADKDHKRSVAACDEVLPKIIDLTTGRKGGSQAFCINIYDVRLSDTSPACGMNWPPTLASTYKYLARKDVRSALHVDSVHKPEAWIECNHRVSSALHDKDGKASVTLLPSILEAGVQVMLFAGDQDLICNHIGVERIPDALTWGGKGWEKPEKRDWFVNNTLAGYWRTNRNLTYVSLAQASHMVGFDKPVEAHDMMLRFMGVDLVAAAGPSARIPSRLDGEKDRLVIVGGGGGSEKDERPMIPGVDGKSEEQVAEEAKWAAYYNAGSAALIVLLILVGCGVYILLRLRRRSRLQLRGGGLSTIDEADETELDRFIVNEDGEDEGTYRDDTYRRPSRRAVNGNATRQHQESAQRDNEEIFDVGNVSDEDEQSSARR